MTPANTVAIWLSALALRRFALSRFAATDFHNVAYTVHPARYPKPYEENRTRDNENAIKRRNVARSVKPEKVEESVLIIALYFGVNTAKHFTDFFCISLHI